MMNDSAARVEAIMELRAKGLSLGLIVDELGESESFVNQTICNAKKKGDWRGYVAVQAHKPYSNPGSSGVKATVIKTVVPFRRDRQPVRGRHIINDEAYTGVLPFGEPEPGRSALDQRRGQA
jgi:hypothetical protein